MSETSRARQLTLSLLCGRYAICRLPPQSPLPAWADGGPFCSIVRAEDELSILCPEARIPPGTRAESGWRALRVHGPFSFSEIGILAALTDVLARAGISALAVSTHDTDYLFAKEETLDDAIARLEAAGHVVHRDPAAVAEPRDSVVPPGVVVRPMAAGDWEAVRAIYRDGMETGLATLETSVPEREEWERKHLGPCRLVAIDAGDVVGWAALSAVSTRAVYAGVAEVSVYVRAAARSRGVGRALLSGLVRVSEAEGIWTLQAGIFPENEPSIRLHRSCGFRDVGVRERLGELRGVWRDVLLMERRSQATG